MVGQGGTWSAEAFHGIRSTEPPDEAFEVLRYLLGEASTELLELYGIMPARTADQPAFFDARNEHFPQGVDWQVFVDGIAYADNPSFETDMPNYDVAFAYQRTFLSRLRTTEGLDLEAEIETLRTDLQAIFDEAN